MIIFFFNSIYFLFFMHVWLHCWLFQLHITITSQGIQFYTQTKTVISNWDYNATAAAVSLSMPTLGGDEPMSAANNNGLKNGAAGTGAPAAAAPAAST
jgi:hypothetical protein